MHRKVLIGVFLCCCWLTGCGIDGISGPGRTTSLGYDLTLLEPRNVPIRTGRVHLAVVQAGAACPDSEVLDILKTRVDRFEKISVLPGVVELRNFGQEVGQRSPEQILGLAEQVGADQVLLLGGRIEGISSRTMLSILDLTILGYYVVPSCQVMARGHALGALVDVGSHRLVETQTSQGEERHWAASLNRQDSLMTIKAALATRLLSEIARDVVGEEGSKPVVDVKECPVVIVPGVEEDDTRRVWIRSDGFHVSVLIPEYDNGEMVSFLEIGSGDWNCMLEEDAVWLSQAMSLLVHNPEAVLIRRRPAADLKNWLGKDIKSWELLLTDQEWGEMINSLESSMMLDTLVLDLGDWCRAVPSQGDYHILSTCQHFALSPLKGTRHDVGWIGPTWTGLLEWRLDRRFGRP